MKLNSLQLNGQEVKTKVMSFDFGGALNTLPNTLSMTFLRPKLESAVTPALNQVVSLFLTNGNATPVNYSPFHGYISKISPSSRFTTIEAVSGGYQLTRLTEESNDWNRQYSSRDIADVMKWVIQNGTGQTQSRSGTVGQNETGFKTNRQDKASLLRTLCMMSYKSPAKPFVFYQSGTTANEVHCEPFGTDGSYTLTVGTQIIGRPQWTDYADEIVNDLTVKYNGGQYSASDSTSITNYGRRKGTFYVYNIDNAADATLIANMILYEWKDPRTRCMANVNWKYIDDPHFAHMVLNKKYTTTDSQAGKTSVVLVCTGWQLHWPSGIMTLTLGNIPFLTSDLVHDIESKVANVDRYFDKPVANVASANARHSHNAIVSIPSTQWGKQKTITFTQGLAASFRVHFEIRQSNGANWAFGQVFKNGAALGTFRSTQSVAYVGFDEDFVLPLSAGDTLELWAGNDTSTSYCQNFQVLYDTNGIVSSTNT
jgi:hypothetical protein